MSWILYSNNNNISTETLLTETISKPGPWSLFVGTTRAKGNRAREILATVAEIVEAPVPVEDSVPVEVPAAKIATILATVAAPLAETEIRFFSALLASTEVVVDVVKSTLPDAVWEATDAAVLEAIAQVIVAVLNAVIAAVLSAMIVAALAITTKDRNATRTDSTVGGILDN